MHSIPSPVDETSNCRITPIHIKEESFAQINQRHCIGIFPVNTKIDLKCNKSEITTLKGTHVFEVLQKCSIRTNKHLFINLMDTTKGHPIVLGKIESITSKSKIKNIIIQNNKLNNFLKTF